MAIPVFFEGIAIALKVKTSLSVRPVKAAAAPLPASGPTVDETGITVNGRKYGFPVRLVTEVK